MRMRAGPLVALICAALAAGCAGVGEGPPEGICAMTFDIRADGTVDPLTIVADCTSDVFEDAAKSALARWRYNPRMVDGVPVARPGVTIAMEFRRADE